MDDLLGYGYINLTPIKQIDRREAEIIENNIKLYQTRLASGQDLWTGNELNDITVKELHKYRKPHIE